MTTEFVDRDLRGVRFARCDLSGAVLRGVDVQGAEIDAPWLHEEGGSLIVNGVDVVPLVEAELDRRTPGRALRAARDPDGLRTAWSALEEAWADVLARVEGMPAGAVEVSVAEEWTFAQTLRHLVFATDLWLGRAILRSDEPVHPLGLPHIEHEADGHDIAVLATAHPTYAEVLVVRTERVARVRRFLATVTAELLAEPRASPHDPAYAETVLACLHTILGEEWSHLRYAVRDLDVIESAGES